MQHADRDRKYPQFQQDEIFGLQDAFRKLDVDDKGYIDEATAIKATQASERQPYDVVRQALKEVELDSSRRVELDDFVGVSHLWKFPCLLGHSELLESALTDSALAACFQTSRFFPSPEAHVYRSDISGSWWHGFTTDWRTCFQGKCQRPYSSPGLLVERHAYY